MSLRESHFRGEKYGKLCQLDGEIKRFKSIVFNNGMSIEKSCDIMTKWRCICGAINPDLLIYCQNCGGHC